MSTQCGCPGYTSQTPSQLARDNLVAKGDSGAYRDHFGKSLRNCWYGLFLGLRFCALSSIHLRRVHTKSGRAELASITGDRETGVTCVCCRPSGPTAKPNTSRHTEVARVGCAGKGSCGLSHDV